jgi:tRNA pseudouridine32 synthase / 23S rRNA pseudouridine746 synthase
MRGRDGAVTIAAMSTGPYPDPMTPRPGDALHGDAAVDCIWADEHLLILYKPAGLPAVPGRPAALQDCLASRAQARWPDALTVHRLDMATSGLMVMARGKPVQRQLSQAFELRQVHKRYQARVHGLLAADRGSIDLPLGADWPRRPCQKVDPEQGKPALTHWQVLGRDAADNITVVELEPVTGRTHQLRVHLCAIGHPIVGDALYGPQAGSFVDRYDELNLVATQLGLRHPAHGEWLQFEVAGYLPSACAASTPPRMGDCSLVSTGYP